MLALSYWKHFPCRLLKPFKTENIDVELKHISFWHMAPWYPSTHLPKSSCLLEVKNVYFLLCSLKCITNYLACLWNQFTKRCSWCHVPSNEKAFTWEGENTIHFPFPTVCIWIWWSTITWRVWARAYTAL
jgi:hypothetical protein